MAIPKIIHFCWMSGEPFPELIQKCVDSWGRLLPDYEIICWDSNRFDVNICDYTREAYEAKKYAFVSDYVRLFALYEMGGIYLDSDIEVIKSFNDILDDKGFTGFENEHTVAAWIFGSEKGNPLFKEMMDYYQDKHFLLSNGEYDYTPNCVPVTECMCKHGLQLNGEKHVLENIVVYPQDYFCPYNRATETLSITDNSYAIHYFNGAWISDKKKQIIQNRKNVISRYGKIAGYIYYGGALLFKCGAKPFLKELLFFMKQ